MSQSPVDDQTYSQAVADLLGVLAYGELTAFLRMAEDCDLAPTLSVKSSLARLAHTEYVQYTQLLDRMRELGLDPETAMAPFVAPIVAFHARTKPNTWLEGLVKAYVGDGIAKDFYREVARFVDEDTRAVMVTALDDDGSDFIVSIIRDALRTDRAASGRLALWGRRLVGEALSQAQAVAVERDALASMLIGGGMDLAEIGSMFERLMENHKARMAQLGLSA